MGRYFFTPVIETSGAKDSFLASQKGKIQLQIRERDKLSLKKSWACEIVSASIVINKTKLIEI